MVHLQAAAQQPLHDLLRPVRGLVPRQVREHHQGHGAGDGRKGGGMALPQLFKKEIYEGVYCIQNRYNHFYHYDLYLF